MTRIEHKKVSTNATFASYAANIAPTPRNVHTAIGAIHSSNIPGRGVTLYNHLKSSAHSFETVYEFEARIWSLAMQRNGAITMQDIAHLIP